jgi:cob(I)alamin adenosyltransferase
MSISTKRGDGGRTRLFSGEEISKSDPRTEAYGSLDEAVSAIGLARALSTDERIKQELRLIQEACFLIGAELATATSPDQLLEDRIGEQQLNALDELGRQLEDLVELSPRFILPGATPASAALDLGRSIVRTVERRVVSLMDGEGEAPANPFMLPFLNRLSDILFLLARFEEIKQGVDFEHSGD